MWVRIMNVQWLDADDIQFIELFCVSLNIIFAVHYNANAIERRLHYFDFNPQENELILNIYNNWSSDNWKMFREYIQLTITNANLTTYGIFSTLIIL